MDDDGATSNGSDGVVDEDVMVRWDDDDDGLWNAVQDFRICEENALLGVHVLLVVLL